MVRLKVKEAALARGFSTIKDFAYKTGISYDTIHDYWSDKPKRFDRNVLNRICEVLECEIADVLEYTSD